MRIVPAKYDKYLLFRETFDSPKSVADGGNIVYGSPTIDGKVNFSDSTKYMTNAKYGLDIMNVVRGLKQLTIIADVETPASFSSYHTIGSVRTAAGAVVEFGFAVTTGKQYAYSAATGVTTSSSAVSSGRHDLGYVFNGSTLYFYVDGVANGFATFSFSNPTDQVNLEIGKSLVAGQPLESVVHDLTALSTTLTAAELLDLHQQDTYSALETPLIDLPLRSWYYNGSNVAVTENKGSLKGTATLGDGTTTTTFPTQLSPHGYSFDGGDYADTGISELLELTDKWSFAMIYSGDLTGAADYLFFGNVGTAGLHIGTFSTTGLFVAFRKDGSNYYQKYVAAKPPKGKHVVVFTYNGNGSSTGVSIYLDGVAQTLAGGNVGTVTDIDNGGNYTLFGQASGRRMPSGSKAFKPKFWKGVELTPLQVRKVTRDLMASLNV